jgi:hypothetical protein
MISLVYYFSIGKVNYMILSKLYDQTSVNYMIKRVERELNAMLLNLKNQEKIPENTYRKLHSSDAIPPAIRGSIKHHKVGYPLRPIVTCIDSALYEPFSTTKQKRLLSS